MVGQPWHHNTALAQADHACSTALSSAVQATPCMLPRRRKHNRKEPQAAPTTCWEIHMGTWAPNCSQSSAATGWTHLVAPHGYSTSAHGAEVLARNKTNCRPGHYQPRTTQTPACLLHVRPQRVSACLLRRQPCICSGGCRSSDVTAALRTVAWSVSDHRGACVALYSMP
jgi:hypothetical protein